jgi:D-galactarolactone cycloisomerase
VTGAAARFTATELVERIAGSPYIDELTLEGFALDADGMLAVPDRPGLGITLDPDSVARHTGGAEVAV